MRFSRLRFLVVLVPVLVFAAVVLAANGSSAHRNRTPRVLVGANVAPADATTASINDLNGHLCSQGRLDQIRVEGATTLGDFDRLEPNNRVSPWWLQHGTPADTPVYSVVLSGSCQSIADNGAITTWIGGRVVFLADASTLQERAWQSSQEPSPDDTPFGSQYDNF